MSPRLIRGRELFYQKHEQKLIRARRASMSGCARAAGYIIVTRGDLSGRPPLYLKSIAAKPVAPFTYVLLLAACLPLSWLDRAGAVQARY